MKRLILLLAILPLVISSIGLRVTTSEARPLQLTPTPAATSTARPVALVNHLGGKTEAVFVAENYAYVNFGPELAVLDISDPARPVRVGYTILPDQIRQIQVAGQYAYIITAQGSLQIVDISDPAAPQGLGAYDFPDTGTRLAVRGNYVYMATSPEWVEGQEETGGGLRIIDVSTPEAPREVSFYELDQAVNDIALLEAGSKHYAYIDAGPDAPQLFDISDPAAPQALTSNNLLPYFDSLIIHEGHAYLLRSAALEVMDLATPTEPSPVGSYQTWGFLQAMAVAGDYVYLLDHLDSGSSRLHVVDFSNPAQPAQVGAYDLPGQAGAVAISGTYALVAAGYQGLRLVDISEPAQPVKAGFYAPPILVDSLDRAGTYGYAPVAYDLDQGLSLLNLADPANPVEISQFQLPAPSQSDWGPGATGFLSGASDPAYRYLLQQTARGEFFSDYTLQVLDTSNPAMPVRLGAYRTGGAPSTGASLVLDPSGSGRLYAYLPTGPMGLRIVEVTDPLAPVETGAHFLLNPTGSASDELIFEDYTIRLFSDEQGFTSTLAIFKGNQPVYVHQEWGFYMDEASREIKDLTGNGVPDLVVQAYTGGAHCCETSYIFELGEALHLAGVIPTTHSSARFEDLDGDGIAEVTVNDWTFAYWNTSFAASPAPEVILRYEEGVYRPAVDLMRGAAPDPAELAERAEEIRTDPEGWQQDTSPPPGLWAEMLDLIYSGQAELAWSFIAQAWPPDMPGQEAFLRSFLTQLALSPYWPEVQALNRGQWPDLLERAPAETGLPSLPAAGADLPTAMVFPVPDPGSAPGEVSGPVEAIFVREGYAYAAMGAVLVVLDISSPTQPRPVGSVALPGRVKDIYVQGDYAYLAKASDWAEGQRPAGGLWVVDVSAPEAPTVASTQESGGELDDLTGSEGYLYTVEQPGFYEGLEVEGKLHVFDLANPAAPEAVGLYEIPQEQLEVDIIGVVEDYIYLSATEGGLFILQFN